MPRDIPVGNGSLLVNFDCDYQLRDFYWPHVGQENHTEGHPFRFGIRVDDDFRWVTDPAWTRRLDYQGDTLVTEVELEHPDLGVSLVANDLVDFHENIYFKRIRVRDRTGRARRVRLFFAQDFHIYGNDVADSAYYEPERRAVFHYKGKRWFLVNTGKRDGDDWKIGVDRWAVGLKEMAGREGTWRDAEDGELSGNAVAQGSVDSVVALDLSVPAGGEAEGWYWIAVGSGFKEVVRLNRGIRARGAEFYLNRTAHYWRLWQTEDQAENLDCFDEEVQRLYRRSLLVLRTQIDNGGAIVAANDFDIARFARDTYSYMWPRDGALVASALTQAGHPGTTRRFFEFCSRLITDEGYLLHKFNPDGSLASSWHGWLNGGEKVLPVQEDETALVLWALWRHFQRFPDVEFIKPLYRNLIIRAAEWLAAYRDPGDKLPLPSWDLWEERWGVLAWTVGAVWGGLAAAAEFAGAFGETDLRDRYRAAAAEIKEATERRLWSEDRGRFLRMLSRRDDGGMDEDGTVDASLMGLWYFGMFPADDPRIAATMNAVRERLWVRSPVGGIARYENDAYQRAGDAADVPGNPWFICTLWQAQWHIAAAKSKEDLRAAAEILGWAADHALPSGIMAEQVHPFTDEPLSVSPLTWSHSTLVATVREYALRCEELDS